MTIEECVSRIEDINTLIRESKSGFERVTLYTMKSVWTNHLIQLLKESHIITHQK